MSFLGYPIQKEERDHNIYFLARGMLLTAAGDGNQNALDILNINVDCKGKFNYVEKKKYFIKEGKKRLTFDKKGSIKE